MFAELWHVSSRLHCKSADLEKLAAVFDKEGFVSLQDCEGANPKFQQRHPFLYGRLRAVANQLIDMALVCMALRVNALRVGQVMCHRTVTAKVYSSCTCGVVGKAHPKAQVAMLWQLVAVVAG